MGSFNGATFDEWSDDHVWYPEPDTDGDDSNTHIPYSSTNVIEDQGENAPPFDLPIQCTAAQLSALRAKRGDLGTLDYGESSRTAYLRKVGGVRRFLDLDLYRAVLTFWVLP